MPGNESASETAVHHCVMESSFDDDDETLHEA